MIATRNLIGSLMIMFCAQISAQNTLNVYLTNGQIDSLDITTIDSINFLTTPPPLSLSFYFNDGTSTSYLYSDIDSIDFAFLPGVPTSVFNPSVTYGTVQDADWNTYNTVQIGNQVWMAENLRSSKYANGDPIPFISDTANWEFIDYNAYTFYELDSSLIIPNGYLYNWFTIADSRNVCPAGWHVPRKSEWDELVTYLGGTVDALGKLKSTSSNFWLPPNVSATNSSGFSAVGSGQINSLSFISLLNDALYWSSSLFYANTIEDAYTIELSHDENFIEENSTTYFRHGHSIRCIQGDEYFPYDFQSQVLNPSVTYGQLEDIEGNRYRTIDFEGQEWMAENLRTSTYSNGDPILSLSDGVEWQNATEGAVTVLLWALKGYGIGKLYNHYAVHDSRNICPTGWRIPEVSDFDILFANVGGKGDAGSNLKTVDLWWPETPGSSFNSIGFNTSPAGLIDYQGNLDNSYKTRYWTKTGNVQDQIIMPVHFEANMSHVSNLNFTAFPFLINEGNSVRCIREIPIDYFPMDSILNNTLTYGTVSDISGNEYKTIVIGGQNWMAQNLRASNFSNGDPIPALTANVDWSNATTPAFSNLYNDAVYDSLYGKLYNFYTASDVRNVCPTNWHVPTEPEWQTLIDNLGGFEFAGAFMKSEGTQYWTFNDIYPFAPGNNSSGFSGLPAGTRDGLGFFLNEGFVAAFWSSTDFGSGEGLSTYLDSSSDWSESQGLNGHINGLSIRCVQD